MIMGKKCDRNARSQCPAMAVALPLGCTANHEGLPPTTVPLQLRPQKTEKLASRRLGRPGWNCRYLAASDCTAYSSCVSSRATLT